MFPILILRCNICDMDYKYHMMSKTCIRMHAMTHLRKYIHYEMLMNQPQSSSSSSHKHESYTCYICGVRDNKASYIINHLGVYHKRLDFYNDFSVYTQNYEKDSSTILLPSTVNPIENCPKTEPRNIIKSEEDEVQIIEPAQVLHQLILE